MIDLIKAIAVLLGSSLFSFYIGFRAGRTIEFYHLKTHPEELKQK
jgi:hypothetical protein